MSLSLTHAGGDERSQRMSSLARRCAVIRWWEEPPRSALRQPRWEAAMATLAHVLELEPPHSFEILEGREALRAILGPDPVVSEHRARLQDLVEPVRRALHDDPQGTRHPLAEFNGQALVLHHRLLPFPRAALEAVLTGPAWELEADLGQLLLDRIAFELGAALLWEAVGEAEARNPLLPLIEVHEEGLLPVALRPAGGPALLWRPDAAQRATLRRLR